jgi:hypothetical protein
MCQMPAMLFGWNLILRPGESRLAVDLQLF